MGGEAEKEPKKKNLDERLKEALEKAPGISTGKSQGGGCSCGGRIVRIHGPGVTGYLSGWTGWRDICDKCGKVHGRSPGGVIF